MEKDTFDKLKRVNKKGVNAEFFEISSTGYGYESHESNSFDKEATQNSETSK
ncbi:hypothetical protein [Bacillus sp. 03113]|uniref:hypothetical protein n=1 Tax=Bacillus sp. 03113 TaxID=2578211 RepID=UPI0015E88C1B|nr:hypothetical protein [Bacillus sp. 03113]